MNVLELLTHYRLEELSPSDLELFAYYGYIYGVPSLPSPGRWPSSP